MRASLWWLVVFLVCGLVGVVGWPAVAVAEGLGSQGGSSLSGSPTVVPGAESLTGGQRQAEEARLANPEAVAQREASTSEYEGLGASEAEKLVGQSFPGWVEAPAGGPPSLSVGEKATGFPTDYSMSVELAGGKRAVVETLAPIAVGTTEAGRLPVDLGLSDAGAVFRSRRPLVGVQIPKRLSEATVLEDSGVSLTPVDEAGVALGAAEGVIDGASVFYGDSEDAQAGVTDLDTLVKPTTAGFELQSVLRSQRSPERLFFKVGLPAGASLLEVPDGGGVQVVKEGQAIASIPMPDASDSAGTVVPVRMEVSGDVLTVVVPHKQGQYQYPILADPQVKDENLRNQGGRPAHWKMVGLPTFEPLFSGEAIGIQTDKYERLNTGYLEYQTQGESKIWEATLETNGSNVGHVETYEQIAHLEGSTESSEDTHFLAGFHGGWGPSSYTLCAEFYVLKECPLGGQAYGAHHNLVKLQMVALETELSGAGSAFAYIDKANVSIYQEHGPSEPTVNTTSPTLDGTQNIFYGKGGWLSAHNGAYEVRAKDPGVGINFYSIAAGSWVVKHEFYEEGKCEGVQCFPEFDETYTYNSGLPEGEPNAEVVVQDATKEYGPTLVKKLRVDNAPPYALELKGMPAGNEIGEGAQRIVAEATDGSGSTHSSGVKSIRIEVDGGSIGSPNGSCAEGPCTAKGEWTIDGGEFGAGEHTLTIVATDNAGNQATRNVVFTVRHGKPTAFATGSLAPQSGDYSLGATDVSMGGGLSFSRVYSSRNLTAGVKGPLGPQWSATVTGDQSVGEVSGGNVVLTSANGGLTVYKNKGGGVFEDPKGDANTTLTLVEKEKVKEYYLLVNKAAGTNVKFTMPSGGGSAWVPSTSEGPAASTSAITYAYRTVENEEHAKVTEPKEVFAPNLAKASCSPTPEPGCRKLTFVYAERTTAKGENESEWGEYTGQLNEVLFTAYDPVSKEMKTKTVADYSYDKQGRLRAEWDPRISPSLKTVYGYDAEGHVTALTKPGQETWAFTYGTIPADGGPGRILKATQAPASAKLWTGEAPKDTEAPKVAGSPLVGVSLSVSNGSWSNEPVAYGYQWDDCNSEGKECSAIPGATNANYAPVASDVGYTLVATVSATNGGGSIVASSAPTGLVKADEVSEYPLTKGSRPEGIAAGPEGYIWVAEYLQNKIAKVSSTGAVAEYGPLPAGSYPYDIAPGPEGDMWFTDFGTDKIGKITPLGTITEYTTKADEIRDIVEGPGEYLWFTEAGTNKIGKMTASGTVTEYTLASGDTTPYGIAVGSDGNLWFSIWGTHGAIGKITPSGTLKEYELPSGSPPAGIVSGPDENLWFTEPTSNKIGKITTSGTVSEYPLPSGSQPYGITVGADHNLWFAEAGTNKLGKITTSGTISEYPVAAKDEPTWMTSVSEGSVWFEGPSSGELGKINPRQTEGEHRTPQPGYTVEYQVPLSGAGLPTMTEKEVEKWGQKDDPVEATAVFPPDEPQGWPASSYKRAAISYFDAKSRQVNSATPSGGIATSEYNETNDVVRALSADNRLTALKEGSKSVETSKLLDTESAYNAEGDELLETTGPQHAIKLAGGSEVQARNHVKYYYDEGAPEGEYRLLTRTVDSALVEGKEEEPRTTRTYYSGQKGLGWVLRKPTSVVTNPEGLDLVHTTVYNETTGAVVETRAPGGSVESVYPPMYSSSLGTTEGSGSKQFNHPEGTAIDSAGNLWVDDKGNHRLQKFSPSGELLGSYGSEGKGEGQFENAWGIAINQSTNEVFVSDYSNDRIDVFSDAGTFLRAFGSSGSGNGQLNGPVGLTVDSHGDVWVADTSNNRVEEFSSTGSYMTQFGSYGTGNGQFNAPIAIAISEGELYVLDYGNDRVEEFSHSGAYLNKFGGEGAGEGQFKGPEGIAVNPMSGNLYVSDSGNERIEEFTPAGKFLTEFGVYGLSNGGLHGPTGLTVGPTGKLYIADQYNARVDEWLQPEAGGARMVYSSQFGGKGKGEGQFEIPIESAIDGSGNVWITDYYDDRVEKFSGTGKFLAAYGSNGSGNGQFSDPTGIDINKSTGNVYVMDCGNHRVEELNSGGGFVRAFGSAGSEPGQLSCGSGVKIDPSGDVWVADTGNNRVQEFSSTGTFIAAYGTAGTGNGQFKEPRAIAFSGGNMYVTDYGNDRVQELSMTGTYVKQFGKEGSNDGEFNGPEGIAVDSAGHLYVVDDGNDRVEEFNASGSFLAHFGSHGSGEGQFEGPIGISINAAGDTYVANPGTDQVEIWAPANQAVHDTKTIYYTAKTEAETATCQNHPEWAGLPCTSEPAAQPETKELPSLPTTTTTYNLWDEPETVVEAFPATEKFVATTRTKKIAYDEAGRTLTSEETSSSSDTALPKVSDEYNTETGQVVKQSTTVEGKTKTITSLFNKLGQLVEYTDADGNKTTYAYDEDGRTTEMLSAKGTEQESKQTYAYDPATGYLTKLQDSGAHTFTASYDVEGNMTSESYPNGMTATYTRNATGEATSLVYEKTTHCTSSCELFKESRSMSVHDEALSQTSTLASETYNYDAAGRLLEVKETPAGGSCTARVYAYDEESNRTSLTKRACSSESGEIEAHKYDPANRLTDAGVSYEALGNTTNLPASDAGGSSLQSTYYADGQVAAQSQSEETIDYYLDPADRIREKTLSGKTAGTDIVHYAAPGESPIWTSEGTKKWTRDIPGIDGALTATETNAETPVLQLHDLEGNTIGTAALSETETKLLSTYNSTEFGVPTTTKPPKYSWLGASGLSSELTSGTLITGTTAYVPQIARTLQSEGVIPPAQIFPDGSYAGQPYTSGVSGEAIALGADFANSVPGRAAARQAEAEKEAEEEALFMGPRYPYVPEPTPTPTEGGAEPLGGYEGWACAYAEETGQEDEGCGGGGSSSSRGDPVAVAAAPCAHEENPKANGCNSKGYGTFSNSCIVKFMGTVSSCNEVLANAKAEYKGDNANVRAIEKGLSEINKGMKEVQVNIRSVAGTVNEIMEDVPPPP